MGLQEKHTEHMVCDLFSGGCFMASGNETIVIQIFMNFRMAVSFSVGIVCQGVDPLFTIKIDKATRWWLLNSVHRVWQRLRESTRVWDVPCFVQNGRAWYVMSAESWYLKSHWVLRLESFVETISIFDIFGTCIDILGLHYIFSLPLRVLTGAHNTRVGNLFAGNC